MDEDLFAALSTAVAWLDGHGYRYAVIGGVATQYWGFPRLTVDIDIKVLCPDMDSPFWNSITTFRHASHA